MEDVLITIAVFGGIAVLFRIITDTMTRHKLINAGLVDEKVKYLFTRQHQSQSLTNIKWGMILVGIGLALLIKQLLPYYVADETMFGLMFLFAGIAYLVYYVIADKRTRRNSEGSGQA